MMMYDREENQVVEHAELVDMRTHLTVAVLAAAQLTRKTEHLSEAVHLQGYLDQSLKSLVEDVGRVDALVAQVEEVAPITAPARRHRRLPRLLAWIGNGVKHGTHALCARLHHRHYTRLVAPSLYR
jgi:hypothetical protein